MRIAYDIAQGMQYLHNIKPPILHRDLRSPNIFVSILIEASFISNRKQLVSLDETAEVVAKVADFGLSRTITSGIAGSLVTWLAPEVVIEGGNEYGLPSDVYSFGIVMWELLTFQLPYDEELLVHPRYSRQITDGNGDAIRLLNPPAIRQAIIHDRLRPTLPKDCPEQIASFITRCWHPNPLKRPTFNDAVYVISLVLGEKLEGVCFDKVRFTRRSISNLGAAFSQSVDSLQEPLEEEINQLERLREAGDYFVSCMEPVPFLRQVWAGTSNGSLVVFNVDLSVESSFTAHEQRITAIRMVGGDIWTSSADGTIKIWNTMTRQVQKVLCHQNECNPVKCICIVSLPDGSLQVWSSSPRSRSIYCWCPKVSILL
jgi:serine/threonine protein kinase